MNLVSDENSHVLNVSIGDRVNFSENFGELCVKSAKEITRRHSQERISILIDESYESAITVLSFLKADIELDIFYIDFINLRPDLKSTYYKVKNWVENLGLKLTAIPLDFKSAEHQEELFKLQNSTACTNENQLFKLWATCKIDNFLVLSGNFIVPRFSDFKFKSWSLPNFSDLSTYNFFKSFGGIPFFLNYSCELVYSQIDTPVTSDIFNLANLGERIVNTESFPAKKIFARQAFPNELINLTIPENVEPIHVRALRSCGLAPRDFFYRLMKSFDKRTPETNQNISVSAFSKVTEASEFYKELFLISEPKDFKGNVSQIKIEPRDHKALAAFSTLITSRSYSGDLNEIFNYVKTLKFFKSETASATHGELHFHPQMKNFTKFIYESAELYFEEMKYVWDRMEISQCWANCHTAGQRFDYHYHPNSFLSGVFYLTTGGGGNTIFKSQYRPQIIPITSISNRWNPQQFESIPVAGKLVLFPSDIEHKTLPHGDSENPRYSIAFNLSYKGIRADLGADQ